jgi:hypothetical protein
MSMILIYVIISCVDTDRSIISVHTYIDGNNLSLAPTSVDANDLKKKLKKIYILNNPLGPTVVDAN